MDYITIIIHYTLLFNNIQQSILNIIKLTTPLYTNKYLAQKLFDIINNFSITKAIISIIYNNTNYNNIILNHFKRIVLTNHTILSKKKKI